MTKRSTVTLLNDADIECLTMPIDVEKIKFLGDFDSRDSEINFLNVRIYLSDERM